MKKVGVLVLLALVFVHCDHDGNDSQKCSTKATVRDFNGKLDGCGWLFELEDGTKLEPRILYTADATHLGDEPLNNFEFVDGKRVLIDYEVLPSPSVCMVGPVIRITCITELNLPK